MTFIKENWFKFVIVALFAYAVFVIPSEYMDRQLWVQQRVEAYKVCLNTVSLTSEEISNSGVRAADAMEMAFRSCKYASDNF